MRFRAWIAVWLLLAGLLFLSPSFTRDARATTIYVGGAGPGNYTTISEALNAAIPGDTVYVYNGSYFGHITIEKSVSLVGENRSTTEIFGGGGIGDVIEVKADWVNITGFTITRSGTVFGDAGIDISFTENCTVAANTITDSRDGLTLLSSANITVANNSIFSNGEGVRIEDSRDNLLADNNISDSARAIVEVRSSRISYLHNTIAYNYVGVSFGQSEHNTFENNTMILNGLALWGDQVEQWNTHVIDATNSVNGKPLYYWKDIVGGSVPPNAGQVILANSTGTVVSGQTITDATDAIQVGFSTDIIIDGNEVSSNRNVGISLYASWGTSIINNTGQGNRDGIRVSDSHLNTVSNNTIEQSNGSGINIYWSSNNIVANNTASNADFGISVENSDYNTLEGNTLRHSSWAAIYLQMSTKNVMVDNDLSDSDIGINLEFWADQNTISGNVIRDSVDGIVLFDSHANNISDNVVVSSEWSGIQVDGIQNKIFHNNFVGNKHQAIDWWGPNEWNETYPTGGNYWSDYNGSDAFSGISQDIPGSDGIGDTAYVLDGDEDAYPLMIPTVAIRPRSPEMLSASLSGTSLEDVGLVWSLSPDDGNGLRTVVGYEVYRNTVYDAEGLGYSSVASLVNGTSSFNDTLKGEGDSNNYFYRLCAVDSSNNSACAQDQAAKFTRLLVLGPNLVSIPLIQSDDNIETVLQTVEYDRAWFYDSSSQEWKWYAKHKGYRRGLWNVNHTMGIWVNVTENSNLTVVGVVPSQTTTQLHEGWNLVSFPSFNASYSVSDLKAEIGATRVEGYDLAPTYFLRVLSDSDVLLAGRAYWMRVQADVEWTVTFE